MEAAVKDLIGQVLVCGFEGDYLDEHAKTLIETHHIANIILFSRNISSLSQIQALTSDLQACAKAAGLSDPLLICTDQENGLVRRLSSDLPGMPGNMAQGAAADAPLSRNIGRITGQMMALCGINMNLAPVLDVNNNPQNPVIGVRSYSDDPKAVTDLGLATMAGLEESGIIPCAKHFPGHGDTQVDSHLDLPVVAHSIERMECVELKPFEAAIAANIPVIMTAHIVFTALDSQNPATLSPAVLTDLLRGHMGFSGVVTTDCLEMNAISQGVGVGAGAVKALQAGADMVMVSHHLDLQEEAVEAIAQAVAQGTLSLSRLQEAAGRIAQLKKSRLGPESFLPLDAASVMADAAVLQTHGAQQALTLLQARALAPWPYPQRVAVIVDGEIPHMIAAGPRNTEVLFDALQSAIPGTSLHRFQAGPSLDSSHLQDFDWLLYLTTGSLSEDGGALPWLNSHPRSAVLLLRTPYALTRFLGASRVYALYENTPWMMTAAVQALLGQGASDGGLAVQVGSYPRGYRFPGER